MVPFIRFNSFWFCLVLSLGCALKTTPVSQGKVVSRQGQAVTVTLEKPERAVVGARYQIWRQLPITHPVTGETLKTEFRPIGEISLAEVTTEKLIGTIVSENTPIRAGDCLRQRPTKSQDKQPPTIDITRPIENTVVSQRMRLEGRITDNVQVKRITLNGAEIALTPATQVPIVLPLPPLTAGINRMTLEAWDAAGNARQHILTVQYAPVRVAVLPFYRVGNTVRHNEFVEMMINHPATALNRLPDIQFYSVEDLKPALQPLGLTPPDSLDVKAWRLLQTQLQLKWLLLGSLDVKEATIEIQVGLVNLDTGQITPHQKNISTLDPDVMITELRLFVASLFPVSG